MKMEIGIHFSDSICKERLINFIFYANKHAFKENYLQYAQYPATGETNRTYTALPALYQTHLYCQLYIFHLHNIPTATT